MSPVYTVYPATCRAFKVAGVQSQCCDLFLMCSIKETPIKIYLSNHFLLNGYPPLRLHDTWLGGHGRQKTAQTTHPSPHAKNPADSRPQGISPLTKGLHPHPSTDPSPPSSVPIPHTPASSSHSPAHTPHQTTARVWRTSRLPVSRRGGKGGFEGSSLRTPNQINFLQRN